MKILNLAGAVVDDEREEFRDQEAVGLKEGSARNPIIKLGDAIGEAGSAPGWAGTGQLIASAALLGEGGKDGDSCPGKLRECAAQGLAERGEVGGELLGKNLCGGTNVERELKAGLIGGGKEFELV